MLNTFLFQDIKIVTDTSSPQDHKSVQKSDFVTQSVTPLLSISYSQNCQGGVLSEMTIISLIFYFFKELSIISIFQILISSANFLSTMVYQK